MLKIEKLDSPEAFTEERFGPVFREMAAGISSDTGYPGLDMEHVVNEWQGLMRSGIAETWAAVDDAGKTVGCLGALFLTDFYTGTKSAMELFWFCQKEARKLGAGMALFRVFEKRAREVGARMCWAGSSRFHDGLLMSALYTRLGYQFWGSNYQKTL